MNQSDRMKYLGELETCAMYQQNLIANIQRDLKQAREEFDNLIERMRGIIRDEKSGQESIDFKETESHVLKFKQKMQNVVDKGDASEISISSPSFNNGKPVVIAKRRTKK